MSNEEKRALRYQMAEKLARLPDRYIEKMADRVDGASEAFEIMAEANSKEASRNV